MKHLTQEDCKRIISKIDNPFKELRETVFKAIHDDLLTSKLWDNNLIEIGEQNE